MNKIGISIFLLCFFCLLFCFSWFLFLFFSCFCLIFFTPHGHFFLLPSLTCWSVGFFFSFFLVNYWLFSLKVSLNSCLLVTLHYIRSDPPPHRESISPLLSLGSAWLQVTSPSHQNPMLQYVAADQSVWESVWVDSLLSHNTSTASWVARHRTTFSCL